MQYNFDLVIIGGGAAGFFAALAASEQSPDRRIAILEAGSKTLSKVAISGGGRCNVTHSRFEVNDAIQAYPRGARELRSAFSRFQAKDTIKWFSSRGVKLKTEADGRVFPVSDSSQTIIDCLESATGKARVEIFKKTRVRSVQKKDSLFHCQCGGEKTFSSKFLLLATGSSRQGFEIASSLGHKISDPVPSLFTFNITDRRIAELSGISVQNAKLSLSTSDGQRFTAEGPVLITHWGLSGPAVLKLSAWGARALEKSSYNAELRINWVGDNAENVFRELLEFKQGMPEKRVCSIVPRDLPRRLYTSLLDYLEIPELRTWAELSKKDCRRISEELTGGVLRVEGKGVFKEEFVTCGGVQLKEIDFRSMQSKLIDGLFFAGEILDIDGLTGGYNFQAAWTGGYIAGGYIGKVS